MGHFRGILDTSWYFSTTSIFTMYVPKYVPSAVAKLPCRASTTTARRRAWCLYSRVMDGRCGVRKQKRRMQPPLLVHLRLYNDLDTQQKPYTTTHGGANVLDRREMLYKKSTQHVEGGRERVA